MFIAIVSIFLGTHAFAGDYVKSCENWIPKQGENNVYVVDGNFYTDANGRRKIDLSNKNWYPLGENGKTLYSRGFDIQENPWGNYREFNAEVFEFSAISMNGPVSSFPEHFDVEGIHSVCTKPAACANPEEVVVPAGRFSACRSSAEDAWGEPNVEVWKAEQLPVHRAVLVIVSDPNDSRIKTRYRLKYHPVGIGTKH